MKSPRQADIRVLQDKTFLVLLIAITLAFAWILWPFYGAVLWATVLAIVFAPLYRRLLERLRQKRGRATVHIPIDSAVILSPEQVEQIVAVDLALQRLAETDVRKSRVFEMRFFGGLTVDEVAEALGVAPNTVIRDWDFARAWLRRELGVIGGADRGTMATG